MKRILLITLFIVFTVSILMVIIFFPVKKRWNAKNSLGISYPPHLSDSGESATLISAIDNSIGYFQKTSDSEFYFGERILKGSDMEQSLRDFKERLMELGLSDDFYSYVVTNFDFYESSAKKVLFTGYFEAELKGSLQQDDIYKYPLYRKPEDLVKIELSQFPFDKSTESVPAMIRGRITDDKRVVPYFSREEIDSKNMLWGKNLELVWVDNRIDIFFLQIQGSGIIRLNTGDYMRVNYSDSNGHPYKAIGRLLVEKGVCSYDELSMQFIRKYLHDHPGEIDKIFNYNPSYVFFRKVDEGPVGSLGVIVTPYRTIATDKFIFPKGSLCYIETKLPVFNKKGLQNGYRKFRGFMMNQDTGGAIRTPSRVDIFFGNGKESELTAGHLKEYGKLFFLVKKGLGQIKSNQD